MKIIMIIVGLIVTTVLYGCIAGPAYPERNGRLYLEKHGYSHSVIEAIINTKKLESALVLGLSKCKSTDVRFLVAQNPNLARNEIDIFIKDKNDFVRSGAACNTSLSAEQIEVLSNDSSHTVYSKLAGNPSLSEDALLRIRKKRNPGLLWFAMNPNCPASIEKEIKLSGDSLAKQWLNITDDWKKSGVYLKNDNGRWYKAHKLH